ncbi:carboxymuconolactone decarboxylase family protein [Paracoccus laeviglucosivorans]|uniref:Alkylhydroperoxidase AhpD family core domain-containing protein n=1 Tax=Paracoccus laeviglucosivorans TaxID=1197861 RepID=A0A521EQB8_9RHOB|nr:carboxymuconolactone decarboxylase family protein [Paracoccus laeviglucosivorans]SMO86124.1 alkylhydroperoxidase AhpD family core domain-containing protein [Paracoccus laeviglucosivorans]
MTPRMTDHMKRAKAGFEPMFAVETAIQGSTLEPMLIHLVKLRASQINGCAFCLQMHVAEALKDGETPLRLHMLPAWRESGLYSERERAALAWTEALTLLPQTAAPDADWNAVEAAFDADERAWLTLSIAAINLWNRVQAGLRVPHATTLPTVQAHAA